MAYDGQRPTPHGAPRRERLNHEQRILLMALMGGLPASLTSLILLWDRPYTLKVQWTMTLIIVGFWFGFAFSLRGRVVRHLQTLSNLLAALREGDYSIRARGAGREDALGDVMLEVNALGETLRAQRLGALEATALLRTVMGEIDVAVFAFDEEERLRLVNRAGERLFAQPAGRLLGRTATELGLEEFLRLSGADDAPEIVPKNFPGQTGRWGVRRSTFRERGLPHQLLVLSDLSRELREEEREAWKRLVRVLGHELNNSLTPIKSIAGSLESLLVREPRPVDWHDDMQRGLSIIGSRSESLSRFMQAYAHLARLPPPRFAPVNVGALVRRVAELETRLPVRIVAGAELTVEADGDQLEQLLINLQRNAVDAALQTGGGVSVSWTKNTNHFTLSIEDEGPGLSNTTNLFVPFFTTKPGGSGIGLVLSRQIAEAHGGTLTLTNRRRGTGCEARLQLPL
ncbi:MAG TPA: ATP-binding protein [Pyrinomonadaceae bacterium]|nr:ATP-binding protein [Pyrinomonadaceae bacterium]